MPRGNTGAVPRKRVTARDAMDAYTAMLSLGTDRHTPEAWRAMGRALADAAESTRSMRVREGLLHYSRDCAGWAKRAELAAKPAGAFYTSRPFTGPATTAPAVDNAGWARADAEIDADDNTDMTGDEGSWGHAEW